MSIEPGGEIVPVNPSQHIDNRSLWPGTEQEKILRKEVCFNLMLKVLTPDVSNSERNKELMLSLGIDFLQAPWEQVSDVIHAKLSGTNLAGYFAEDAVKIARVYFENEELSIPERVVYCNDFSEDPNKDILPNEKVLVLMRDEQSYYAKPNRTESVIFAKNKQVGTLFNKQKVELTPPDVYISDIDDQDKRQWRERLNIAGIGNLFIGGKIQSVHNTQIDINCEGNCFLLPGAQVSVEAGRVRIDVGGDVFQSEGSINCAREMLCHSYIQEGGELAESNNYTGGQKRKIVIRGGKFEHLGGRKYDPNKFEVVGDVAETVSIKNKYLEDEHALINGGLKSPEIPQLSEFDRNNAPTYTGERKEIDGSTTFIQSHLLVFHGDWLDKNMSELLKFQVEAMSAGYNVDRVDHFNGNIKYKNGPIEINTIGIILTKNKK